MKKPRDGESLSYKIEVRDKHGKLLQSTAAPSHCYVEQWNQIMSMQFDLTQAAGPRVIRDTGGTLLNSNSSTNSLRANAAAGVTNYGIRVGRGSTAVAIDDFSLETPCAEGAGANQVEHQAAIFTAPAVVGGTCSFTVSRRMINNSGANIAVTEIGCYIGFRQNPAAWAYALGFRDVPLVTFNVPDGGSITVGYLLAVTV